MNSNDYVEPSTSSGEPSTKRTRLNEDNENQDVVRHVDISELNVDSCEAILDYLNIKDLAAFGRTCKWMQQIAGDWFRQTYKSNKIIAKPDAICLRDLGEIEICHFSEHITKVIFFEEFHDCGFVNDSESAEPTNEDENSDDSDDSVGMMDIRNPYKFVQLNCSNASIKHIEFVNCSIISTNIECITNILNEVKSIKIKHCYVRSDLYQEVLQFCNKMTHLHVNRKKLVSDRNNNDYRWLLRTYPTLEHFVLEPHKDTMMIDELPHFFQINPNIRNFSTNTDSLLWNRTNFLKLNVKFNVFAVLFAGIVFDSHYGLSFICETLGMLHTRGFYQQLYFYFGKSVAISQEYVSLLASLEALGKLHGKLSKQVALSSLINLEELIIDDSAKVSDWNQLTSNLLKLKRVGMSYSSIEHIEMLISNAAELKGIMVKCRIRTGTNFMNNVLDIFALNKQRKQLRNAQKVLIYVPEWIYIATKRSLKQTECGLVKIKRIDSNDWFSDFDIPLNETFQYF